MIGTATPEAGRKKPEMGGELAARIASALFLAVIAVVGAVLGGWAAAIVLGIVMAVVHLEWVSLTERSPWPSAVFTGGLVVALAMITLGFSAGGLTIIGLAILAAALTLSIWRPAGVAYAAILGAGLLLLRLAPDGLNAILVILAVVWATDTGAYVVGRTIGGTKLWPAVSPGKTRSGAVGGLVAGAIAGILAAWFTATPISPILLLVIVGLSIASQAGDLFESWVKRRFGAKDSGRIIPGHGGLMDRVDGLVFAAGLATLIGWLHAGPDLARGLLLW